MSEHSAGTATTEPPAELSVDSIRVATGPVLQRLVATAAEREQTRDYAFDEVRVLAEQGITLTGIATADGGAGGSLRDVTDLVVEIARVDSNVAQALRGSFLVANKVATRYDLPNREVTLHRLRNGDLFAGTVNERNGSSSGTVTTTLHRSGVGLSPQGEKYYSTGGLYATWFSGTAQDEHGNVLDFTVPVDREGVRLLDDFDAVGQRLTASGTTRLVNVPVSPDELQLRDSSRLDNPWQGSFAQLYLCAVQAGIAAAALDDAIVLTREKARPIKHSPARARVEDPYVREVVGEIAAHARAAKAVVRFAAEELQNSRGLTGAGARAAGAQAAVAVAQSGVTTSACALRAAELLFDVGGGSITNCNLHCDRHWRNARTVANHNPRRWRAAVAGSYHLTGEELPTTGRPASPSAHSWSRTCSTPPSWPDYPARFSPQAPPSPPSASVASPTPRGRGPGLAAGYLAGALGGAGVVAAGLDLPALLLVWLFLYGAGTAANLQARYAGTDLAAAGNRARAVSTVLVATTVGGVVGPNLAAPVGHLAAAVGLPPLTGLFLISAAAFFVAALVLILWLRPDPLVLARSLPAEPEDSGVGAVPEAARPAERRNPGLWLGVVVMVISQLVMVAIMTMTPVHMHDHGHSAAASGLVIALHVGAIYLPSPLTGALTDRFGPIAAVTASGVTLLAAGIIAAASPDDSVVLLTLALVLLGLG